ncbi:hypothetical protein BC830DRAFT_1173143 [Chytriomyces sp. MP71]|nr:hypothetical protein BC830DRAFT_1173143 [Chytriomyces sp. MP71]
MACILTLGAPPACVATPTLSEGLGLLSSVSTSGPHAGKATATTIWQIISGGRASSLDGKALGDCLHSSCNLKERGFPDQGVEFFGVQELHDTAAARFQCGVVWAMGWISHAGGRAGVVT